MWPRWMSGAVGSSPSLTRSGRPSRASLRSLEAPAGRQSTALRARNAAAVGAGRPSGANARVSSRRLASGLAVAARAVPRHAARRARRAVAPTRLDIAPDGTPHERRRVTRRHRRRPRRRRASAAAQRPADSPAEPRRDASEAAQLRAAAAAGPARRCSPRVSTVFGMMMAVASDLPDLESRADRAQLDALDRNGQRARRADRQPAAASSCNSTDIAPVDEARDHRDRGPALLRERRRRPARHRPRALSRTSSSGGPSRAARRSPSSSSRTRSRRRTSARCSRRCARRRSPTTSRASGPRRRSSRST